MRQRALLFPALLFASFVLVQSTPAGQSGAIGVFSGHQDVGAVAHPGAAAYDPGSKSFTIAGSGENMWFGKDQFHFVWKKVSSDVALSADVVFLGTGGNGHRKAVLMIRQSLETDSPYADVALHGDGLTSLQYRDEKGAATHEVQSAIAGPRRLRLEKRGDYFAMSLAREGAAFELAGGSIRVPIKGTFYVGIGVCSHEKDAVERAVFTNLELAEFSSPPGEGKLYSMLETVSVASTDRRVVYATPGRIEAPNWTHDGKWLLFNRDGRIEQIPSTSGTPKVIDTGFAVRANNDHGISPDGQYLVLSDQSQENHQSLVYIVPSGGGTPRRVTQNSPSYWHGWSPDGKTLAFVGQRNNEFDIYTIPAAGGEETRLTTAKGLDDGPEYSPDGKYIYFNSVRSGRMQIWRMHTDGSNQEQVTFSETNDWFPHISPDGSRMVFLSYEKEVEGHPENKDVALRLMSFKDGQVTVLARLFGGQGTINVPSWSPDGSKVAFVSYTLERPAQ